MLKNFCDMTAKELFLCFVRNCHHIVQDDTGEAGFLIESHATHCATLMVSAAWQSGITKDEQFIVYFLLGLLHDVGKLVVNPFLLCASQTADSETAITLESQIERDVKKLHIAPEAIKEAFEFYLWIDFKSVPRLVVEAILGHHQRKDGSGYPSEEEHPICIHPAVESLRIIDGLEAGMCEIRSWREPRNYWEIVKEMEEEVKKGKLDRAIINRLFHSLPNGRGEIKRWDTRLFLPPLYRNLIVPAGKINPGVYERIWDENIHIFLGQP